jgi:hypothetical protein
MVPLYQSRAVAVHTSSHRIETAQRRVDAALAAWGQVAPDAIPQAEAAAWAEVVAARARLSLEVALAREEARAC